MAATGLTNDEMLMTPRDTFGMLLLVAGLALGVFGWSARDTTLAILGAVLFAAGVMRIYTQGRERRITKATADVRSDGYAWRLGRRRDDGDGDGDGDDHGSGSDGDGD